MSGYRPRPGVNMQRRTHLRRAGNKAACGAVVSPGKFSADPDCAHCLAQARLEAAARERFEQLRIRARVFS